MVTSEAHLNVKTGGRGGASVLAKGPCNRNYLWQRHKQTKNDCGKKKKKKKVITRLVEISEDVS